MKKASYMLSMIGYVLALLLGFIEPYAVMCGGISFIFSIIGGSAFHIITTVLFNICIFFFATLSYFKSKFFLYILRSLLFVNAISMIAMAVSYFSSEIVAGVVICLNVLLLGLTFFEKDEAVTKEEKKSKVVNAIVSFVLGPIIIYLFVSGLSVPFGIVSEAVAKNSYYKEHSYTTEKATTELSNEIFNSISQGTYSYLKPYWYMLDLDSRTTAKLKDSDIINEYWIIDNNEQLIMETCFDSWDNSMTKDLMVKNDFVYPNVYEDKVANVYLCYGDVVDTSNMTAIQLNDSQIKELHEVAFLGVPEENSDKIINKKEEGLHTIKQYCVCWEFEGAEKLVYQEGTLLEIENGKYILNYENVDGYHYIISDEINEIIENAVSIYE